ncbi:MAG: hypothetical protein QOG14_3761, partial [Mycobacterium sp.]|nr:hypothetical protein [Mycobacterium sp.]
MLKIVKIDLSLPSAAVGQWLAREMDRKKAVVTDTVSDTSIDPSEREFGPGGISLSPYRFPTGWFIIGFASDLAAGEVKRVHYFGEEMVLFRTESGEVNVLDAYCQHLGANMGVGGTVEGEN